MLPINPAQTYSRFKNLMQKRENQNRKSNFDNNYDMYQDLQERLDNIRSGAERRPLTGKNGFSQDNVKLLNKDNSKDQRYASHCPECHDTYKNNVKKQQSVVLYRSTYKRVEISS